MKINEIFPPRNFRVGIHNFLIKHTADITLESNELVTFKNNNFEYDVCKKEWGFYATPSIDKRLISTGYKTYLVSNRNNNRFIMLVEQGKETEFQEYLDLTNQNVLLCLSDF